jgi:hypothetical protein
METSNLHSRENTADDWIVVSVSLYWEFGNNGGLTQGGRNEILFRFCVEVC